MSANKIELYEADFPGNTSAFNQLVKALVQERCLAFTGSGTSAAVLPTWRIAIFKLIDRAFYEGLLSKDDAEELRRQTESDPLEVASELEDAVTPIRFRAWISELFCKSDICTTQHEYVIKLPFSGVVTLNYDDGLSNSFVKLRGLMPDVFKTGDGFQLAKWQRGHKFDRESPAILHLHGVHRSPHEMIFTSEDYKKLYTNDDNTLFIKNLWRSETVVVIGFGFTDPYLIRMLEWSLRDFEADNAHFAFIGRSASDPVTPLVRRRFTKKFKLSPIFYPIEIDSSGVEDHSALEGLLSRLLEETRTEPTTDLRQKEVGKTDLELPGVGQSKSEFEKSLLVSPHGIQLYVEPRIHKVRRDSVSEAGMLGEAISISDVLSSGRSFIVSAPHEYGLSSLGKRLAYELAMIGEEVHVRDARQLPDYRKKLEADAAFSTQQLPSGRALILDNVSFHDQERCLKEIVGLNRFSRIIMLVKTSTNSTLSDDSPLLNQFDTICLSNLQREDIRTLATQMYGTNDVDLISGAVDKVYKDLLDLCIPLTPANIIMYLSVLYKEGDFMPISRLQIIDRYIRELLRRPSDAYRESFNVDNKLDVLSLFVNNLYGNREVYFGLDDWTQFCKNYMTANLIVFDDSSLLEDLLSNRVLLKIGKTYAFRYKLFYSFFLGRYVANRPLELREFLNKNDHMQVEGLVEVISGLSADNTLLINDLCEKLEVAVKNFRNQYGLNDFDPYRTLEWTFSPEEESKIWQSVTRSLEAGPTEASEVDKVKRSILSEMRTEDQAIAIRDFSLVEEQIVTNQNALIYAINNAIEINGQLKIRSINAIYAAYKIAFQVGVVFAPIIAGRRYFSWNGMSYINELDYVEAAAETADERTSAVLGVMPSSVSRRAAHEMGSKKLAEVYRYLALNEELEDIDRLLNFTLVIRSKPADWMAVADKIVRTTDRKALYLRYMLSAAMRQFHEDVNTNHERGLLKRVIAGIQARRQIRKAPSNPTAVSQFVEQLESKNYFDKAPDGGSA